MRTRRAVAMAGVILVTLGASGCASLQGGGRQQFAAHVAEASKPVYKGYRSYVEGDASLNENEKRMRLGLVEDLERYVEGGKK